MIATKATKATPAFSSCVMDVSQENCLLIKEYSFPFFLLLIHFTFVPLWHYRHRPCETKSALVILTNLWKKNLLTHGPFNFCSSIVWVLVWLRVLRPWSSRYKGMDSEMSSTRQKSYQFDEKYYEWEHTDALSRPLWHKEDNMPLELTAPTKQWTLSFCIFVS